MKAEEIMEIGYQKANGIYYPSELRTIRKKDEYLRPLFEAFINSFEAILIQKEKDPSIVGNGEITISLFLVNNLTGGLDFQKITVEDSGIGFDDTEFERFMNLRDDRKNYSNKGTGRVQFIHFFNNTCISSIYKDSNSSTGYKKRKITLSKNEIFLKQNSIIRLDSLEEINADKPHTILTFETLLDKKDFNYFSELDSKKIKFELIRHYLAGFCEKRNILPQITIKTIINSKEETPLNITSEDIPTPDKEENIDIYFSKINNNIIEKTSRKEEFNLKSFLIPKDDLEKNGLKLVSKGEIAKELKLNNLLQDDQINGNKYLFLLSGNYINERDSDARGDINIPTKKSFMKDFNKDNSNSMFDEEEIFLDDIEETTNRTIVTLYKEIEEKKNEKEKNIDELQQMFLLNTNTIQSLKTKIKIDDTDESILIKVYEADAKITAEKDATLKQLSKDIELLTPDKEDYQNQLKIKVDELVRTIPLQNRTSLSRYVARRKIVLDLFQKILDKETEKLKNNGRIDEDIMHNLIFQQTSTRPEDSDLWLINEEFIYFQGCSENCLKDIQYNGSPIFKEDNELTEEEKNYRFKKGDANLKRTDILLFPNEGKCIIIELKAPGIEISDHLNQINKYASLINNLSKDSFKFSTYYGYLIGENIEIDTVRDADSDFKSAYNLDYYFRPYKAIAGKFGRQDGTLYTEIIKYSTLLERAKLRNKMFIEKLEKK